MRQLKACYMVNRHMSHPFESKYTIHKPSSTQIHFILSPTMSTPIRLDDQAGRIRRRRTRRHYETESDRSEESEASSNHMSVLYSRHLTYCAKFKAIEERQQQFESTLEQIRIDVNQSNEDVYHNQSILSNQCAEIQLRVRALEEEKHRTAQLPAVSAPEKPMLRPPSSSNSVMCVAASTIISLILLVTLMYTMMNHKLPMRFTML